MRFEDAVDPLRPRLRELPDDMVEAIAVGNLHGQPVELHHVTSRAVGERLQIRAYQDERAARLCLVDGEEVVAYQQIASRWGSSPRPRTTRPSR